MQESEYYEKMAIAVKGDPTAPFSKATTPRGTIWRYSFLCIVPL